MSKTNLKELVSSLTEEQQQLLYEKAIRRRGDQFESGVKTTQQYDIAIVGLSGRYPQSDDYHDFWNKLQQGINFIQEVPEDRWDHGDYYDSRIDKGFILHKTRCKFGAFLRAYDSFDAPFFDLNPDEVFDLDPQGRLALETTWSCIEDAGYVPTKLGLDVGIFSGITYGEYQKLIPTSTHSYILSNRIAYFFNFQGPAVTVDAGCCSSLTAIHLACQSLIKKECQAAIVIGSNIILHPDHYTSLSPMLSRTTEPYSNPFGIDDGWIPAEGAVSILLKPLKQAILDRDHIYAIIKSSHICQEGKTSWFGAFNPKQQAKLIQDNFRKSGIHPETIGYVEAAANGSSLGDAIELEGLTAAFNQFTSKKQICPIGSVKSNVGHGEGVSTLLQLTKVLLQLKTETLIPLINLGKTNPNIKIENTPFYFQRSAEKWEPRTVELNGKQFMIPRRATISSFGAGGSIGHLILEEYKTRDIAKQTLNSYFIPLSAKTVGQLQQTVENYIRFFEGHLKIDKQWESNYTLLNIMFTLCTGRAQFKERVVFIVTSLETLIKKLHQFLDSEKDPDTIFKAKAGTGNTAAEDNQAQVKSAIENQSWHDLAKFWVQGQNVSLETFFNSYFAKHVSLPTYSFQKLRYPIPKPIYHKLAKDNLITQAAAEMENSIDETIKSDEKSYTPIIAIEKPDLAGALKRLNDDVADAKIINIFTEIFASAIDKPASKIDFTTPLERYGFNSTMVIFVANRLEKYFGTIPKTLFFECQTIQDVIDYFIKEYPDEIRAITQKGENVTFPETIVNPFERITNKPNCDGFRNKSDKFRKPEEHGVDDEIKDLAKAILSNSVPAEMVLKKITDV